MKNPLLCFALLSFLIQSCTPNTDVTNEVSTSQQASYLKIMQSPENTANPYDIAGKASNDLLEEYSDGEFLPGNIATVSQIIDSLAIINSNLQSLNLQCDLSGRYTEILSIIADPQTELDNALARSSLSAAAKENLSDFISTYLAIENNSFENIYYHITNYESAVMSNASFSSHNKSIILTTTSVMRYSSWYGKRKDRDWRTTVGNIAAAISGAEENILFAIEMQVVTGIGQKYSLTQ